MHKAQEEAAQHAAELDQIERDEEEAAGSDEDDGHQESEGGDSGRVIQSHEEVSLCAVEAIDGESHASHNVTPRKSGDPPMTTPPEVAQPPGLDLGRASAAESESGLAEATDTPQPPQRKLPRNYRPPGEARPPFIATAREIDIFLGGHMRAANRRAVATPDVQKRDTSDSGGKRTGRFSPSGHADDFDVDQVLHPPGMQESQMLRGFDLRSELEGLRQADLLRHEATADAAMRKELDQLEFELVCSDDRCSCGGILACIDRAIGIL